VGWWGMRWGTAGVGGVRVFSGVALFVFVAAMRWLSDLTSGMQRGGEARGESRSGELGGRGGDRTGSESSGARAGGAGANSADVLKLRRRGRHMRWCTNELVGNEGSDVGWFCWCRQSLWHSTLCSCGCFGCPTNGTLLGLVFEIPRRSCMGQVSGLTSVRQRGSERQNQKRRRLRW